MYKNIAVMQYIQVDNNKVHKKSIAICHGDKLLALFYALVAVST